MDDTPNDMTRQVAPPRDEPRQPPSLDPAHFTMTVEDASARFADAGLPRSVRSIQRYCQRGHLSCTTVDTEISEMYLIDPESVERRIRELEQIEFVTRASGVSRQDVASDKTEAYERRIKELEDKAMHLEIDKRAREQIINMLKEDRETLFAQVSNHVRTITDQARIIGQLETRLELGPGRVVPEQPEPRYEQAAAEQEPPVRRDTPPVAAQRQPEPSYREQPTIEYPPRYGTYEAPGQGDNRPLGQSSAGVQ